MDSSGRNDLDTNAEVNGTSKQPVATYKPIAEDELDRREKAEEMGKPEHEDIDDGAKEKMLNDEQKLSPKKDASQVIFISENGDAKIDVAPTGPVLSGMGKEELMKYANDPFWVRLRWFLFIGFWVLWFAMLAGAVAIIVFAPKCTPQKPKTWWEKSPIVQLEPIDLEGKDEISLGNLLDNLKNQHVTAISLASMLKSSAPGHTTDFRDIVPHVSMKTVRDLIKLAEKREQKVILELDPNHSGIDHVWFNKSVHREEPYTNYYVWASAKMTADGSRAEPNNWLSRSGHSAWQWNDKREQYYLHQFNSTQPDLNFNNSLVIDEFNKIFSHWLDQGISGFRLGTVSYLCEDPGLHDENRATTGPVVDGEYDSLIHVNTRDREDNIAVLSTWRANVKNRTNSEGLFALRDDVAGDTFAQYNEKNVIDLPQWSAFLDHITKSNAAQGLNQDITSWLSRANNSWPGWDLNGNGRPLRRRVPSDVAESITLMSLLLPGTPILKLNDTQSRHNAFAILADERTKDSFLFGDFNATVINGTVFSYTRLKSGSPGFIVAYQSANESANIDLSVFKNIPDEVSLLTNSSNYIQEGGAHDTKFSSKSVPISPRSTIVLTFVSSDHS